MTEATGMEAKTIHRLLKYKPPEGYQKNEEKPLEGDVLILDECSMIDIMLKYNLLKYCTKNLPNYYHVNPLTDIQVLTPMQRGVCGAANLNQILQEAMNPSAILLRRGGTQFRLHDKVMPFTMSHFVMLQRNLLYTGVTRAKKILVLIGEKRQFIMRSETKLQQPEIHGWLKG